MYYFVIPAVSRDECIHTRDECIQTETPNLCADCKTGSGCVTTALLEGARNRTAAATVAATAAATAVGAPTAGAGDGATLAWGTTTRRRRWRNEAGVGGGGRLQGRIWFVGLYQVSCQLASAAHAFKTAPDVAASAASEGRVLPGVTHANPASFKTTVSTLSRHAAGRRPSWVRAARQTTTYTDTPMPPNPSVVA